MIDRVERRDTADGRAPVIAVVLGGGWKLGSSFHAGVLLALHDVAGIDVRAVDSLTGTSAGAVTAGFVGAGFDAKDLFGREVGSRLSDEARQVLDRVHHSPSGTESKSSDETPPKTVNRYFDDLTGRSWPRQPHIRLCAVDTRSGRVATLDAHSGATPGQAVAASCSIPGLARPVRIGNHSYIDGAVRSVNNAETVVETAPDIVVISAPLSADRTLFGFGPMTSVRNSVRVQTARERSRLERSCHVITIEPSKSDLAAMGSNLNDATRREHVARHAYASACATFEHQLPSALVRV